MQITSFQLYLEQLHQRLSSIKTGAVADYIPELSKANPDWFGIAMVTVDGHVYQVGDTRESFSIQSISKAFTYGIALEDRGADFVAEKIDVEPSGEAFNSISLESDTGRPRNPMINAGAIVATSLVDGNSGSEKIERILQKFTNYVGRSLDVDKVIYQSEKTTGHRNRAIAHLLRNYNILEGDPEEPLDAYFQQCSILVTARDLAIMGATLANDGVNPITGVRALETDKVPLVLSVMATCGMYDYSGNWIHRVGMPAKSGVGGGVVAVLPGQLGLAIFSPCLDAKGNSVRGIAVCEAFSREFGLHMLRVTRTTSSSVIRSTYTADRIHSKLNRDTRSADFLQNNGQRILVMELTGELMFVSAEIITTTINDQLDERDFIIIDFTRVTSIGQSASALLAELAREAGELGKTIFYTGADHHYQFVRYLKQFFKTSEHIPVILHYEDVDHALEYAEDCLLEQAVLESEHNFIIPLCQQPLCNNLDDSEQKYLQGILIEETFDQGQLICKEGDPADKLYFLSSGRVSASLKIDHKRRTRLFGSATGWAFGESSLFEDRIRTADIIADSPVKVFSFEPKLLREHDDPLAGRVLMKLLSNLAALSLERLGRSSVVLEA